MNRIKQGQSGSSRHRPRQDSKSIRNLAQVGPNKGSNMNNEYCVLLEKTAGDVDKLIMDSAKLGYFRSQIDRLCDMAEARAQAIKPLMEQARDYQKQKPIDTTSEQQKQDWNRACSELNQNDSKATFVVATEPLHDEYFKFCTGFRWALPLEPPNPIVWFPGCSKFHFSELESSWVMNSADEEMRDAVVLAVIHDWGHRSNTKKVKDRVIYRYSPYDGQFFKRDAFLSTLENILVSCRPENKDRVEAALIRIERALSHWKPESGITIDSSLFNNGGSKTLLVDLIKTPILLQQ